MYVVMCCSVHKLKLLIKEQTDLDPCYQELFYENLPYRPAQAELAAKLPTTTVSSWHVHVHIHMCTLHVYDVYAFPHVCVCIPLSQNCPIGVEYFQFVYIHVNIHCCERVIPTARVYCST